MKRGPCLFSLRDAFSAYKLFEEGKSLADIADDMGKSRRTVNRYLKLAMPPPVKAGEATTTTTTVTTTTTTTAAASADGSPLAKRKRPANNEPPPLFLEYDRDEVNDLGSQHKRPVGRRLKSEMIRRLVPGFLVSGCDCGESISVFDFCGVFNESGRYVCCIKCARSTATASCRRHLRMNRLRAITWLMWCGESPSSLCALCEDPDHPLEVLGDWQLCHIEARARCGEKSPENLFPGHASCNVEQHTLSLLEVNPNAKGSMDHGEATKRYKELVNKA
jgi:hypothetical protein